MWIVLAMRKYNKCQKKRVNLGNESNGAWHQRIMLSLFALWRIYSACTNSIFRRSFLWFVQMKAVNSRPKKHGHQISGNSNHVEYYDMEYQGNGTANWFLFFYPIVGWWRIDVTNGPTAANIACKISKLVDEDCTKSVWITLVKDNLNAHVSASLYKEF